MEPETLMEASRKIGNQVARKLFDSRGNHSEAHFSESELAALIALGSELAFKASERARDDYEKGNQPGGAVAYAEAELKRGVR